VTIGDSRVAATAPREPPIDGRRPRGLDVYGSEP